MEDSVPRGPARWPWVVLLGAVTMVLLAGAYAYYRAEFERIRRHKHEELAAIGALKAGEIHRWREERLIDVRRSAMAPFFKRALAQWLRNPNDPILSAALQARLSLEQKEQGYRDVLLLDPAGRVLLSASREPHPVSPATKRAIEEAIANRAAVLSDLYRCPTGVVHMDAVAPILGDDGNPVAVWVLRSNAESYLYPLIQSWPTPSGTAETLLVRKDGEEVCFLNELRHRPNSALSLRQPLTLAKLPATQAVLGKQGIFEGKDYRGVEVLADLCAIPQSDWFMVAKVDASELLAEAGYRGGVVVVFCALFILLAAGVTAYVYSYRQSRLYRSLYRVERERRTAQERFRATLYSIGDAVITTDTAGAVQQMNPVAEHLTGCLEAEAAGNPLEMVFHILNEDSRVTAENPVQRVLREGRVVGLANHTLLVAKDGTERPIADSGAPIFDDSGAISGVVLVFRNQTEERAAQKALQESEERYRAIFETAAVGIDMVDETGRFIRVNDALARMLGYSKEELCKLTILDITHPEDVEVSRAKHDALVQAREGGTYRFEKRYVGKDGRIVCGDVSVTALRESKAGYVATIGVISDVTARKEAEEEVKKNSMRLQCLVDISAFKADTIRELLDFALEQAVRLTESRVGYVSRYDETKQLLTMHQWSKSATAECRIADPQTVYELETTGMWGEAVRHRKPILVNDFQSPHPLKKGHPEGHVVLHRFLTVPVMQDDRIVAVVGVANKASDYDEVDVRELSVLMDSVWRIVESRRLQESERLLATAIEQASEGVLITDTGGRILYANPALETMTGYTRQELEGQTPRLLKSGEHDRSFYRQLWDTITSGRTWSGRIANRTKDGRLYHEEATISPVKDLSGRITHFVALKRDITEHLQLSKQLFQAQKMEAVGTLAGGVAHDFNNLLQVILGYSDLILAEEHFPEGYRDDLGKVNQAARSGADLVRRLLTFSRKSEFKPIPLDMNGRIKHVHKLLARTLPKMIQIDLVLADKLPRIHGDPTHIEQILMNLAVNARDAMENGGKLAIETSSVFLDADYAKTHLGATLGRYVLLKVADTGKGIDKDTLEHIFEPFYTTKGPGEGTGLGLAMVYGIVKQHDGYITCYSEPGEGTTFKVYFPALDALTVPEDIMEKSTSAGGRETILVVDDDELIRDLGSRMLSKAGYTVLTAANGREALAVYRKERGRIALVVLDLIMPEMGGRQCLEELVQINPKIRVIIASGYSADTATRDVLDRGAKGFVGKPFILRELLQIVRKTLDEAP